MPTPSRRHRPILGAVVALALLAACGGDDGDAAPPPSGSEGTTATVPDSATVPESGTVDAPACPDAAEVSTAVGNPVVLGSAATADEALVLCPYVAVDANAGRSANVSYFLTDAGVANFDATVARHGQDPDVLRPEGLGDDAIVHANADIDEPGLRSGAARVGAVTVTVKVVPGGLGSNPGRADQAVALLRLAVAQVGT